MGTIVERAHRRLGVGTQLIGALEAWARDSGFESVWVATERATDFYRDCGWELVEKIEKRSGDVASILVRRLS